MLGLGWIRAGAVAALIGAGIAASVAIADTTDGTAGGVVYRSDSTAIGPPPTAEVDVSCPGRKHASGAGFGTVSTVPGPLNRFLPIDGNDGDARPDDGWELMRTDEPGGNAGTAFIHVMCDSKGRSYRSTVRMIPDGDARTVKAKCDHSQHVSGGGAVLLGAPFYGEIESTYPFDGGDPGAKPDDGWAIRASNLDHQPRRLKVVAVCTPSRLIYRAHSVPLLGGGYNGLTPPCRAPHLVGMGAQITSPPAVSRLENLDPADSGDPGGAPDDYAIGDGSSETASGSMKVFAICR